MKREYIELLAALKGALCESEENKETISFNVEDLYQIAQRHKVTPLLCNYIFSIRNQISLNDSLLNTWKGETFRSIRAEYNKFTALLDILEMAKKEDVTFTVFKGCILGDSYPQYGLRKTTDTDLLAKPEQRERACLVLENLGYRKNEENSKTEVYVYVNESIQNVIELHFYLWEDYSGHKINVLSEMDLIGEEKLISIDVNGKKIPTLGYTEHLIYQMFHIIKHFSLEGIGIRYLVDIILFYRKYKSNIIIEDFWEAMSSLEYKEFCLKFFEIGIRYLGMNIEIIGSNERVIHEDLEQLIEDLMCQGQLESIKNGSYQILGIMTPFFVGEEELSSNKKKRKLQVMFPAAKSMRDRFSYARKNKYLLPIAWIHRFFDYALFRVLHKGISYGVTEKLTIAEYRLTMMRSMGLVKERDSDL